MMATIYKVTKGRHYRNAHAFKVAVTTDGDYLAFNRKVDAVAFAQWAQLAHPNGISAGDPEGLFLLSDDGLDHICENDWESLA